MLFSQVFFIEKFCVLWNCLRPPTQGVHYNSTAQFHLDAPNHFRFSGVEFSLLTIPHPPWATFTKNLETTLKS